MTFLEKNPKTGFLENLDSRGFEKFENQTFGKVRKFDCWERLKIPVLRNLEIIRFETSENLIFGKWEDSDLEKFENLKLWKVPKSLVLRNWILEFATTRWRSESKKSLKISMSKTFANLNSGELKKSDFVKS